MKKLLITVSLCDVPFNLAIISANEEGRDNEKEYTEERKEQNKAWK